MSRYSMYLAALVVMVMSAFTSTANAATCAFGSLSGSLCTVTGSQFDVQYNLANVGAYGDARIIGNNVIFTPSGFSAVSQDGAGTVNMSGQVVFDILSTDPGFAIEELNLIERGRYQLSGPGSSVNHTGSIEVFDMINSDFLIDSIDETAPMNINDNQSHNWTATGEIYFLSQTLGATITINNSLTAFTAPGTVPSFASIEKTFNQNIVILGVNEMPPTAVPVPAAVWLFGSALGLLGYVRRKSQ